MQYTANHHSGLLCTGVRRYNLVIMAGNQPQPFSTFGQALKELRQKTSKTQVEVSGAVEIDLSSLISFELGETRPSEDILLLIIQHFELKDQEAAELWRLAGYGHLPMDEARYFMNDDSGDLRTHATISVSSDDARIVYTDMVQVMVNNYGVIINFMQGAGVGNGPLAVARVGMSKEHAKSVLEVLNTTLDQAHALEDKAKVQKRLPPASSPNKKEG